MDICGLRASATNRNVNKNLLPVPPTGISTRVSSILFSENTLYGERPLYVSVEDEQSSSAA
jgi:hypothetical protein